MDCLNSYKNLIRNAVQMEKIRRECRRVNSAVVNNDDADRKF